MKGARACVVFSLLSFVGLFIYNSLQLRRAAEVQKRMLQGRLQKAIVAILQTAHGHQDDLLMQGTLQALGETPGILFAAVVNEQGLVLAHSQPAQIGTHFHNFAQAGLAMVPLKTASGPWGQFILSMPDTSVAHLWKSQVRLWIFETFGGGILIGILGMQGYRIFRGVQRHGNEIEELLQASEQKRAQLLASAQESQRRWHLWLSESVERCPGFLVLLDHQQKVVCMNRIAAGQLGIKERQTSVGKSWIEIPLLQEYGSLLEQSVYAPDLLIGPVSIRDLTLSFFTFHDVANKRGGTWIGA
jgi:hypothetical protein